MDVVVNSTLQSPLVRTLATTATKDDSFTFHIKDNIPPVSKSRIELNPEGGASGTYGRSYKFKIPQYGYLHDLTLKFSGSDLAIPHALMDDLQKYINQIGSNDYLAAIFGEPRKAATGSPSEPNNQTFMFHAYVPYEEGFTNAYTGEESRDPWALMWLRLRGGQALAVNDAGSVATFLGRARICPFRYSMRLNAVQKNAGYYVRDVDISAPANVNDGAINERVYNGHSQLLQTEGPVYYDPKNSAAFVTATHLTATPTSGSHGQGSLRSVRGERVASTWDWCTQSNLSKYLGALIPSRITLSTHNRAIQTIEPFETLARIYRMPTDKKQKYLAMIRPHLETSPGNHGKDSTTLARTVADAYGTDRTWVCYFPCFFAFFEQMHLNLDTRFVENLEIDVSVRPQSEIFDPADLGPNSASLGSTTRLTNLSGWDLPGHMIDTLPIRRLAAVVSSTISVQLLAYYHNFHDMTSQAIREANYKPNVPANLLVYDTYAENAVGVPATTIIKGGTININLQCNNLTREIVFLCRRKQKTPNGAKECVFEDYATTLPIKSVTLTGSGQQIHKATGVELMLCDPHDFDLSTNKTGYSITNNSGIYADNFASGYVQSKEHTDSFFAYHISFNLSSDFTYNSGSIALQTINNPVLSIEFAALDGWVIQDDVLAVTRQSLWNRVTPFGVQANDENFISDNDYEILVYENFHQMVRIDSNTGAITKSLNL